MSARTKIPAHGSITISYSFLGIAFVILLGLLVILRIIDYNVALNIKLTEYMGIAKFGCVTIGLTYNAIALQYNYKINRQKFELDADADHREKIRFTYEVTSTWYKSDMATNAEIARRFIGPYKGFLNQSARLAEFKDKLESEQCKEQRRSLIAILNFFENLSLLLADDVIDEDILKKCFRTLFIQYYHNLKEYIADEQSGNSGANSKIFISFVTLSKKWAHS